MVYSGAMAQVGEVIEVLGMIFRLDLVDNMTEYWHWVSRPPGPLSYGLSKRTISGFWSCHAASGWYPTAEQAIREGLKLAIQEARDNIRNNGQYLHEVLANQLYHRGRVQTLEAALKTVGGAG
jgi:hypothetical protein